MASASGARGPTRWPSPSPWLVVWLMLVLVAAGLWWIYGEPSESSPTDERRGLSAAVSLPAVDLSGQRLADAKLIAVDLSGADLSHTHLERADLRKATLVGARMTHVHLRGANLMGSRLVGARMRYADLRRACLKNAVAVGARLQNADLRRADVRGADLRGTDLSRAQTVATVYDDATKWAGGAIPRGAVKPTSRNRGVC
ncbi:MAG: hypothetical protein V7607_1699 [Solirubrobacteraceae bacterium]